MSTEFERDEQFDLPELRQRMAEGILAMVELGKYYLQVEDDGAPAAAASHLHAAAIFEHPEALFYLAQMHLQGNGVEKDDERAVDILIHLSRQGLACATNLLKAIWKSNICRDRIDAYHHELYERCLAESEEGDDEAMVQAAILLLMFLAKEDGPDVEEREKAKLLLKKAASLGNMDAFMMLHSYPNAGA